MDNAIVFKLRKLILSEELSREAALPLRLQIEQIWDNTEQITIDFNSLGLLTLSYLDELIGKLFLIYRKEDVMKKLVIKGLSEGNRQLLGNIVTDRIRKQKELSI